MVTVFYRQTGEVKMEFWGLIILGLLYGITGFLPISSSGHLSVIEHTLGYGVGSEIRVVFNIGAVILIVYTFRMDMKKILKESFGMFLRLIKNAVIFFTNNFRRDRKAYLKIKTKFYDDYALFLFFAMIPEVAITVLLQPVAFVAGSGILIPGLCLIINGVILLIADNLNPGYRTTGEINIYTGLIIGLVQGVAFLPGFSYLAVAFTMSLLFGYRKEFAVRTSFFLMIPVMLADSVYHILGCNRIPEFLYQRNEFIGVAGMMIVLIIVGYVCIRATLLIVKKKKFWLLAAENLILGAFAVGWHFLS